MNVIVIGYTGIKTAYLNVWANEAVRRWNAQWDNDPPLSLQDLIDANMLTQFTITDEMGVYDAWPSDRH